MVCLILVTLSSFIVLQLIRTISSWCNDPPRGNFRRVGVCGHGVGLLAAPLPAGREFVGTSGVGSLDSRETLDMDDDDVFKVGFSVVEGCSGAEYQDITDTVKILSNGRLTAN